MLADFKSTLLRKLSGTNMPIINRKFKSLFGRLFLIMAAAGLLLTACQSSGGIKESESKGADHATPGTTLASTQPSERPAIVAFGDSLTAGYELQEEHKFTSVLQRKLDEKGYPYQVVNAGVSGDTSAGAVRRIDWALQGNVKFLILEL